MAYDSSSSKVWDEIKLVAEHHVLVCFACRIAIPAGALRHHIRRTHRHVSLRQRRVIEDRFSRLTLPQTWADLPPRPDPSPVLPYLQEPVPGFFCSVCLHFKTRNYDCLRQHRTRVHPQPVSRHNPPFDPRQARCFLQCWTKKPTFDSYWRVNIDGTTLDPCSPPTSTLPLSLPSSSTGAPGDVNDQREAEAEEEQRLLNEQDGAPALDHHIDQDEKTDWLRASEWPQWFANRPLSLIVAASMIPVSPYLEDFVMGNWGGLDCRSPVEDEVTLSRVLAAMGLVFDRCEATLDDTPRMLRCWLRSWTSHYLPYPFEMVQKEATKRRYYRLFQRFFCYVFRVWRLETHLHEPTSTITGLQLNPSQRVMIKSVWNGFYGLSSDVNTPSSSNDSIITTTPDPAPPSEQAILVENLFQLMMMFWTDTCTDGSFRHKAIVHFSGVLGIHPYELVYRTAYSYTPYLSALIWVGRLLFLEYSLPLRAYTHLTYIWPDRQSYPDQFQRLNSIRFKYLLRGSLSPLAYLIERLQHGRATVRHSGPPTNIMWSYDGQTLHIGEETITMSQLRQGIHAAIARTRQQTHDLLFGWRPVVCLDNYRDDLVTPRLGYSFLAHPDNRLQDGFRILSHKAFSADGGFSLRQRKGQQRAHTYLRQCNRLTGLLFGAIHVTSGMPGRCEELRTLRWANTETVRRNILLYRGQLVLVFAYNKASTHHNNTFYVVRAPCPAIQDLLFIYLAYIRP